MNQSRPVRLPRPQIHFYEYFFPTCLPVIGEPSAVIVEVIPIFGERLPRVVEDVTDNADAFNKIGEKSGAPGDAVTDPGGLGRPPMKMTINH
jgi:hypothetical protein